MKKTVLTIFFLYTCLNMVYGQNQENSFGKEVKLNLNARISEGNFSVGELAPVLILENKRQSRHEFELNHIGFSNYHKESRDSYRNVYTDLVKDYRLGIRYQFTYPLLKGGSITPYLAGAYQATWHYYHIIRGNPRAFDNYENSHENILELVPGARWPFSEKVGIDLSFVIPLFYHRFLYERVDNPYLPIRNQRNLENDFYSRPFEQFHSRIGVYVKL